MSKQLIVDRFRKYESKRGWTIAEDLVKQLKKILSKQAKTRKTKSGKIVATEPAIPFAPPRRVTGKLQKSVGVTKFKNIARVHVRQWYGRPLEFSKKWYGWPHKYIRVVLAQMKLKVTKTGLQ